MGKNCKNSATKECFIIKGCFKVTPKFFFSLSVSQKIAVHCYVTWRYIREIEQRKDRKQTTKRPLLIYMGENSYPRLVLHIIS